MNNDTLDILRNADAKDLKAIEIAIKTVKKREIQRS